MVVSCSAPTGTSTPVPAPTPTPAPQKTPTPSPKPAPSPTPAPTPTPTPPLTITTTSLPNGHVGVAYSQTLAASGGSGTYTWSISAGSLAPGLSLAAATGVISGTPTTAGISNFTAQVADGITAVTQTLSVHIWLLPLTITTTSLLNGHVGVVYSQTLAVSGGSGIYTWSISAGLLPAGLSLAATGVIFGTPTTAGTSNFTVHVADGISTATQTFSINIGLLPLTIATTSLLNGHAGVAYSQTLAASGGGGTYTWSLFAGLLPAGLSLATATGVISGTPTTAGTSNFTVRVTDGITVATKLLSIMVNPVLAITITTTSLPDGDVGVAYSQTLTASGGSGTYTWSISAGALPAGLSLMTDTGVISGIPTIVGTSTFTVRSTDGITAATQLISIKINPVLTITTTSLLNGDVGVAYLQTLTASGGSGIYIWSISAGLLPTGLSLTAATGAISGTPTTAGTSNFTVRVSDGITAATQPILIKINPVLTITTSTLPNGDSGGAYLRTLTVSGGSGTYTWSIFAGALPSGLSLVADTGAIFGTPTSAGIFDFTVRVSDGITAVTKSLSLKINPAPTITITSLPNSNVGVAYSLTLTASGGSGTYTWSISAGSLPAGLSLAAATGVISGTATTAGTSNFTLQVADGISIATKPLSIKINPALTITTTSLPNSDVGVAYSQTLAVSGGSGIYTWSIFAGSLPAGLLLTAPTGIVFGTPTTAATSNFTVQVADGITTATQFFSITINPALTITTASLPNGDVGVAYSQTLTVSGGSGIYTWSIFSGSLPPGLSLAVATGAISGTPTSAGTYNFTVRVADGITTATRLLSITIR